MSLRKTFLCFCLFGAVSGYPGTPTYSSPEVACDIIAQFTPEDGMVEISRMGVSTLVLLRKNPYSKVIFCGKNHESDPQRETVGVLIEGNACDLEVLEGIAFIVNCKFVKK